MSYSSVEAENKDLQSHKELSLWPKNKQTNALTHTKTNKQEKPTNPLYSDSYCGELWTNTKAVVLELNINYWGCHDAVRTVASQQEGSGFQSPGGQGAFLSGLPPVSAWRFQGVSHLRPDGRQDMTPMILNLDVKKMSEWMYVRMLYHQTKRYEFIKVYLEWQFFLKSWLFVCTF